ncbi:YwbE family protein [Phosphitispora fastidiosa]|uniref:YwbE family protein n=1 Tax=Phosphitispora fastidiosa TaxID=2837202 RepID=UPI0022B0DCEF|nr:YwbE family protein [Phosphitispora fastidiosa]MBU7005202.1 putative repeat protein (TIGR03833 family) [Phosphitispora fastidiosa]
MSEHTVRKNIKPGMQVEIVEKQNQRSGKLTAGEVQTILTPGQIHPRGIKVRLTSGQVGRVQRIIK